MTPTENVILIATMLGNSFIVSIDDNDIINVDVTDYTAEGLEPLERLLDEKSMFVIEDEEYGYGNNSYFL